MNTIFIADGPRSSVVRSAVSILIPIVAWVGFSVWRGYSTIVVLGLAAVLGGISLWAVKARGTWRQIAVGPTALTLRRPDTPELVIQRESLLILELRDKCIIIKWRTTPKDRVELLARERFTASTWDALRKSLEPWVK